MAISLSRVFTRGDLVCFADESEGKQFVSQTLDWLIHDHAEGWGLKRFKEFHNRIVAVMFHLAVPWDVNGERLIHIATSNFVQTGNSRAGWETMSRDLASLY